MWSAERLKVPAGRLRGLPFTLPAWQVEFLRGALADGVSTACLSTARKNGKSGLIAALLLGFLVGPLRREAWRALVVSLTGQLAGELRRQVEEIAEASQLHGVEVRRSPAPGRLVGPSGSVDILAADKASGHAAGADLAIVDEAGLLPERRRPLWDAIRTATSGRDGRVVCISVLGDGPMFREALERDGQAGVFVKRYEAPADCDLADPKAWHAANPGLESGIKSLAYMADKASEAVSVPASAAGFRSLDLNQPIAPSVELLCDVHAWRGVEGTPPAPAGRCWLGIDLGGSASLTAAVALWESGAMRCWVAIPAEPDPETRGRRDGVGDAYVRAIDSGHLTVCGRKVADVRAFLAAVLEAVPEDAVLGCDRYRKSELLEVLAALDRTPSIRWRGTGASATADGAADVRAFQRAVALAEFTCEPNPMMRLALSLAAVRRDAAGNPALDKSRHDARIDLASAAVIACGLRALARKRPARRSFVVSGQEAHG
ncbi:MAG: terminase large subunit [Chloroflexi bacterium]|nr:terminase large subunit [Chloroflexota bacterium]